MTAYDAARWIGSERDDVIRWFTENPFDFAEAGLALIGGANPRLRWREPEGQTISNAGIKMSEAEKAAEKDRLFREAGVCRGCGRIAMTSNDLTLDRIFPGVLSGRYVEGNCQLLCGSCNSRKGTRTMSYLWESLTAAGNQHAKSKLVEVARGRRDLAGRLMRDIINQRSSREVAN